MSVKILHVDTPQLVPMPFSSRYSLSRDMELKYSLDGREDSVIVPAGYLTDGASIPAIAWQIIGTPYSPQFITAAIVHDYMCDNKWDVEVMSTIFKMLLMLSDVPSKKASAMYAAVFAYKSVV
ncbi:hypothetical protein NVP1049O_27 [Vibrio phage 1.049.O._10N.286.54.B5]|nr:hypothetical protein NVP1049O_27 [Vibrio phage 1.049.O._10N.286.54.B5]AUR84196.1 hypothetical protein NVP1050O_27 [Vibrio phage 1.050.O._10N.286.48.A6]AUR84408.1 hypothetical protein NVP1055O_32 [Vibrio phage 1.055.O._10N.286.55.E9]